MFFVFFNWLLTFCRSSLPIRRAPGGALRLPGYSETPGVAGRSSQRVRHPSQHGEDESGGRTTLPAVLRPLQVCVRFPSGFFFFFSFFFNLCHEFVLGKTTRVSLLCAVGASLQSSSRAAVWRRLSCTRCNSTRCSQVSSALQRLANVTRAASRGKLGCRLFLFFF